MARGSKKRKKEAFDLDLEGTLSSEVLRGIWAILCVLISLFLALAAVGLAGVVGTLAYENLSLLLGVGYFLLPLLGLALAATFLRPLTSQVRIASWVGAILFFISGLGLIHLLFKKGGLIGGFLTSPLIGLFDTVVSGLLLGSVLLISVILILELKITTESFKWLGLLRKPKDPLLTDEENYVVKGDVSADEDAPEEIAETDPEEVEPETRPEPTPRISTGESPTPEEGTASSFAPFKGNAYAAPPLSLLEKDKGKPGQGDIKANANIIKRTMQNFGIQVEIDEISIGPTVTRYALKPAEGVRLQKIVSLQTNLELALAAHPVRIEAPIPGRSLVGIEVPNTAKSMVGLATLFASESFQNSEKHLLMALGKDITGQIHSADLGKMPHLLIAGTTGSGKSATIHALITSLLFRNSPEMLRFIMVDPKRVELTLYNGIPHLLNPVITEAKKTIMALKWAAKEMDRRYDILETEHVRDISSYHKNVLAPAIEKKGRKGNDEESESTMPEAMPYIVIVIDELADIMQAYPRELEAAIVRLAQMSRAVGIHLILSTQRPSVNVITGLIKANIPARIALQVNSQIDSRTILDTGGAEKLLGAGDMLYLSGEMSKPMRIQSAFISEVEIKKVTSYLVKNNEPELSQDITTAGAREKNVLFDASLDDDDGGGDDDDDLYEDAREIIMSAGKASTSYLQRRLRVGYARAARLMDLLEQRGVIGPADGAKPRDVLGRNEGGTSAEDENLT